MKKLIFGWVIILLSFTLMLFLVFSLTSQNLRIYFLDVGQGDSILLRYPSGEKLLIDTGKDSRVFRSLDLVLPWYYKKIDYVLLTHSDLDHVGAMNDILDRYSVKKILISEFFQQEDVGKQIVAKSLQKGVEVQILKKGDTLTFGASIANDLYIMHPDAGCFAEYQNTNECSLTALSTYGSSTALFTGDIGKSVEQKIMRDISYPVDILKVAHHGSKNSSDETFLQKIKPLYSIVSTGENTYGHPSSEALAALRAASSTIFNTKEDATVVASSDGKIFKVGRLFDQSSLFQSSVCAVLLYSFDTSC